MFYNFINIPLICDMALLIFTDTVLYLFIYVITIALIKYKIDVTFRAFSCSTFWESPNLSR